MDLMKNRQLDSEIRIKAYLAVIECPCAHSANEIKTLLETEPVHQGMVLGPTLFIVHVIKTKQNVLRLVNCYQCQRIQKIMFKSDFCSDVMMMCSLLFMHLVSINSFFTTCLLDILYSKDLTYWYLCKHLAVGRFITSSLRHIRSSANPDRAHQQHHYSQIRTPNKFNVDDR